MKCSICDTTRKLQKHHIRYEPEMTITICTDCHKKLHPTHGVGLGTGEKTNPTRNQRAKTMIGVYIKPEIREMAQKIADAQGRRLSEYVRGLIATDLDERGLFTPRLIEAYQ